MKESFLSRWRPQSYVSVVSTSIEWVLRGLQGEWKAGISSWIRDCELIVTHITISDATYEHNRAQGEFRPGRAWRAQFSYANTPNSPSPYQDSLKVLIIIRCQLCFTFHILLKLILVGHSTCCVPVDVLKYIGSHIAHCKVHDWGASNSQGAHHLHP